MHRLEHILAPLLSLQHQAISGRATGVLRRRRSAATDTYRRFVTLRAVLQIDHTEFPFPLVERADGVEELLLRMKSEVSQLLAPGLAPETVELLAMYLEDVADAGIPTEHSVKDVVKIGQVQRVRHGYQPDDHWVNVAENRTQNVDSFVCELVQHLRFFRSFDPAPADGRLLARYSGKQTFIKRLRLYLSDVAAAAGISTRIVPHQLRHTYASELVRAGISLPALMTLLGHVKAEMTMKYVLVAGEDLQREFHLARSQPRHLAPQPKAPIVFPRAGLEGIVDSLLFAQHAIEMFRRSLPDGPPRHRLDQLSNRLTKILSATRKLNPAG